MWQMCVYVQVEYAVAVRPCALCGHFHVHYVGKAVKCCDCMPELVVCQNMSCNVYSITLYINNMTDLQKLLLEFISFFLCDWTQQCWAKEKADKEWTLLKVYAVSSSVSAYVTWNVAVQKCHFGFLLFKLHVRVWPDGVPSYCSLQYQQLMTHKYGTLVQW